MPQTPHTAVKSIAILFARFLTVIVCITSGSIPTANAWQGGGKDPIIPQSLRDLADPALDKALLAWNESLADTRKVVDVVCLVPNRETFLEALATWDDRHYFPILLDDTDLSLKFIRAFGPKKVVRFPRKAAAVADDALWPAALTSALRGMLPPAEKPREPIKGTLLWLKAQPRSPGLVLTKNGPDCVAAAALAAGRRQGLLLWTDPKKWGDSLKLEEAIGRLAGIEKMAAELKIESKGLGDDLDFLTLVGDLPYRYQTPEGENCLDDLIGRGLDDPKRRRWAYTGRITGDTKQQIYQVMCGLFLQPDSASLLNGYDPSDKRFNGYQLAPAKSRFDEFGLNVTLQRDGNLGNWRKLFLPVNRSGLVMINSSGNPTSFNLQAGSVGSTWDVPWTSPTRIHIIHSFSAADPGDPYTLAGRWIANGAYAYFGSVNEPYLQSFRSAGLISDCLTRNMPWAPAVRQNPDKEMFGNPWRLMVVGDPMMRLVAPRSRATRVNSDLVQDWPTFQPEAVPQDSAEPLARLAWAVRQAIVWAGGAAGEQAVKPKEIAAVLLKIKRDDLPATLRPIRDELAAHMNLESHQYLDSLDLADDVPPAERSVSLARMIESAAVIRFQSAMSRADLEDALPAWRVLVTSCPRNDLREMLSAPIKPLITTPVRKRLWIRALENLQNRQGVSQDLKEWSARQALEAEKIKA